MAQRSLRLPLTLLQLATVATLARSVALDRWITVAVSLLLLLGTLAAARGRTWGVALSFMLGITLASAWMLGIAPMWFSLVGLLAVRPFMRMFPHFLRFDRGAAMTLAAGATTLGALGGFAWKSFAFDLFAAFPLLRPSAMPHHGMLVLAIAVATGLSFGIRRARADARAEVGETGEVPVEANATARTRIAEDPASEAAEDALALAELETDLAQAGAGKAARLSAR